MGCTEVGHSHPWPTSGTHSSYNHVRSDATFAPAPRSSNAWKYAWFLRRHVRAVNCKTETNKATHDLDVATVWFVHLARRFRSACSYSTRKEQSSKDKKKAKTIPKEEGDDDGDEESEPEEGRTEKGAISVGSSWAQQPS